jgi:hypothetical protein
VLRQISFLIRFALPFFGSVPRGLTSTPNLKTMLHGINGNGIDSEYPWHGRFCFWVWFLEVLL